MVSKSERAITILITLYSLTLQQRYFRLSADSDKRHVNAGIYKSHLELAAYHEAGHTLIALQQGIFVESVAISRRDPGAGETLFHAIPRVPVHTPTAGNIRAAWLRTFKNQSTRIRILLAGPLAEAKVLGKPLRWLGAHIDLEAAEDEFGFLQAAHEYLSRYCPLPETVPDSLLDQLRRQTRRLIAYPKYWLMIQLLAEELVEHGSLTSKNIAGIIGRGNVTWARVDSRAWSPNYRAQLIRQIRQQELTVDLGVDHRQRDQNHQNPSSRATTRQAA